MKKSQEIQLKLSESREKINGFTEETPELEMRAAKDEYIELEKSFRAEVMNEEYEDAQERMKAAEGTPIEAENAEVREFNDLYKKASMARLIMAWSPRDISEEVFDGAEREFIEATLGKDYKPSEKREGVNALPMHFFPAHGSGHGSAGGYRHHRQRRHRRPADSEHPGSHL